MKTVRFHEPDARPIPVGKHIVCVTRCMELLAAARFCEVAIRDETGEEISPEGEGFSFSEQEASELKADGWAIETREEDGCLRQQDVLFWANLDSDLELWRFQ